MMTAQQNHDATNALDRPRGGNGQFLRTPETAERDAQACRLRARAWTYTEIARELGFASPGHAYQSVQRALVAIVQEPAEELIRIETARLDEMWRVAVDAMRDTYPMVQHGRIIEFRGVPLEDPGPKLAAIDRLLKIMDRRARLLGMDAPKQIEVLSLEVVQREIARMEAEELALAAQLRELDEGTGETQW